MCTVLAATQLYPQTDDDWCSSQQSQYSDSDGFAGVDLSYNMNSNNRDITCIINMDNNGNGCGDHSIDATLTQVPLSEHGDDFHLIVSSDQCLALSLDFRVKLCNCDCPDNHGNYVGENKIQGYIHPTIKPDFIVECGIVDCQAAPNNQCTYFKIMDRKSDFYFRVFFNQGSFTERGVNTDKEHWVVY